MSLFDALTFQVQGLARANGKQERLAWHQTSLLVLPKMPHDDMLIQSTRVHNLNCNFPKPIFVPDEPHWLAAPMWLEGLRSTLQPYEVDRAQIANQLH